MHLIPAAGTASRFKGLPKFLLPAGKDGLPIIVHHIESSLFAEVGPIAIGCQPEMRDFLKNFFSSYGSSVEVIPVVSKTMTQTISVLHAEVGSPSSNIVITLPDTFFSTFEGGDFASYLSDANLATPSLLIWEIQPRQIGQLGQVLFDTKTLVVTEIRDKDANCHFQHSWGAMVLKGDYISTLKPTTVTIGENIREDLSKNLRISAITIPGKYYDCGTFSEYRLMLSEQP